MRQADKKKQKDKVAIALMLCFCVIALTSIFTIKANLNKIQDSQSGVPVSEKTKAADETEKSKVPKKQNLPHEAASQEASSKVPTVDSKKSQSSGENTGPSDFVKPVKDENAFVTNEYSMDQLIYSVTLDQYMVHCGVDLEAPADTQVVSMADGTVTAVYSDDRYGNSVEITYGSGLVAVYSNLSDASMVETGDMVTAGQPIGGVGSTGLFESLEPSHLHLELLKDGVYVDPMDYIRM